MTRTFLHSFDPPADSPVTGATVDLTVADIEDAGIREVLQTPGAAYGAWSILEALLTPTGAGTPFIFKEPLGQAREVKVALSGLFGRFVARAYAGAYVYGRTQQRTQVEQGCCFALCLVESSGEFAGLFRRRIAWDDGAIWEAVGVGAVAVLMIRCCRSGEDVGARAPSVGKC